MLKVKEFIKENQKKILIINGSLIVFFLIFIVIINISYGNKKELEKELISLGRNFYENEYYPLLSSNENDRKEFLTKLEKIGLNFNLDFLIKSDSNKKDFKFINSKTNKECDKIKTQVIITPKANYSKKDYNIKAELVCGFDN